MSLLFINHLLYQIPRRDVTAGEFLVLLYLCDKATSAGEDIYPGYERLATWTDQSEAYVRHVIRQFKARGWVSDYVRAGLPRWRLRLPGLVVVDACGKAVETLLKTPLFDDPTIAFHDPRIVDRDPRIVGHTPEAPPAPPLPATPIDPPSFVPSFVPSKEGVPGGGAALPSLSPDVTPEEGRVRFAMLKARLDAQRAAIAARPRRRRGRR